MDIASTVKFEGPGCPLFERGGLPPAWAGLDSWRILQTGAPDTVNFLHAWATWKKDPCRPRLLHFVAMSSGPVDIPQALRPTPFQSALASDESSGLEQLARLLSTQLYGLLPGFHRLVFEAGQVLLTLCIGKLNPLLREQNFAADSLLLLPSLDDSQAAGEMGLSGNGASDWDQWTVKSLARCCRRGTSVAAQGLTPQATRELKQAGFDLASDAEGSLWTGRYNPAWEPRTNRRNFSSGGAKPGTCVVVGAGLAGASVAASLARRGWQVQVLDAAATPAGGASGLPVGLMMPHVSADDSPRSRLSRSGLRLTHQEAARRLIHGVDWSASGVLERRLDGASGLPAPWPVAGNAWSQVADGPTSGAAWLRGLPPSGSSLWHARGAWIKPARLVQAWLSEPGVSFSGNALVESIEHVDGQWVLHGRMGKVIAQSSHVVLANAMGTVPLLAQLANSQPELIGLGDGPTALRGVAGQVSWAMQARSDADALPPFPVNGSGSLIPSVPVDGGLGWFVGATYESMPSDSAASAVAQHQANLKRLTVLLPAVGQALGHHFETGAVQAWRNTRCTSANRLPVVGPLMPGPSPTLWICTALGSRGLSLSVLCAELLASRLCAEPWPVEATLAASLDALR